MRCCRKTASGAWPLCRVESNNQYLVAFDRTLGLGPIPRTTISPAIAERTIAIRRTFALFFTSKGVFSRFLRPQVERPGANASYAGSLIASGS